MTTLKGAPASMGIAIGPAYWIGGDRSVGPRRRVSSSEAASEIERFRRAVGSSREEVERARDALVSDHGNEYAPILETHVLMHRDASFSDAVEGLIREECINAEWALDRTLRDLKQRLLRDSSSYFRERANDLDHVGQHLLRHLGGGLPVSSPQEPSIVVSHDLTPADAVRVLAQNALALVTAKGGATGHTAILARALGIPAVVGVSELSEPLNPSETVIVDGLSGEIVISPSDAQRRRAEQKRGRFVAFAQRLQGERDEPTVTRDGVPVSVCANIELPVEIDAAIERGADGIGLYRTEFLCFDQGDIPSEDEQTRLYAQVVRRLSSRTVVFRTFDFRGEKALPRFLSVARDTEVLRTQLRAILRASVHGSVKVMFPMVSGLDDLRAKKRVFEEAARDLATIEPVPSGIMVEVPSAALMAYRLASHCSFFSVGTNDLTRLVLALDRNSSASMWLSCLHPKVLRLLDQTQRAASDHMIDCGICGDMAAHPLGMAIAIGLGFRRLSVPVGVLPMVRAGVRRIDAKAAGAVATDALRCGSAEEVQALVVARLRDQLGDLWLEQGMPL